MRLLAVALVALTLTGCAGAPTGTAAPCESSASAAADVVHTGGTWREGDLPLGPADVVSTHWQLRVRDIADYCDARALPDQDPIEYTILLELTPARYAALRAGWATSGRRPAVPPGLAAIAGPGTTWLGDGFHALADNRPYLLVDSSLRPA